LGRVRRIESEAERHGRREPKGLRRGTEDNLLRGAPGRKVRSPGRAAVEATARIPPSLARGLSRNLDSRSVQAPLTPTDAHFFICERASRMRARQVRARRSGRTSPRKFGPDRPRGSFTQQPDQSCRALSSPAVATISLIMPMSRRALAPRNFASTRSRFSTTLPKRLPPR